jgi:hypothetical protein
MSKDSWTCLLVEKGPALVDDAVRNALKRTACEMQLHRVDRLIVKNDIIDGVVTTTWSTHLIGTRSGVLFKSHLDSSTGSDYKVNFMLSVEDLERGAEIIKEYEEGARKNWSKVSGTLNIPDLYQFEDLRTVRRNMMN